MNDPVELCLQSRDLLVCDLVDPFVEALKVLGAVGRVIVYGEDVDI